MKILCVILLLCSAASLGFVTGSESSRHTTLVVHHDFAMQCFNGSTWDRCRQSDGGILLDAKGNPSSFVMCSKANPFGQELAFPCWIVPIGIDVAEVRFRKLR
jgi:hypothetical protein